MEENGEGEEVLSGRTPEIWIIAHIHRTLSTYQTLLH